MLQPPRLGLLDECERFLESREDGRGVNVGTTILDDDAKAANRMTLYRRCSGETTQQL